MSSTNRSEARHEHIADYYVTPKESIRKFIKEFEQCENFSFIEGSFLDPCAGGDEKHDMSYPSVLQEFGASDIDTIDLRTTSLAKTHTDFLLYPVDKKYDMVITNPPFILAQEIIEKSFEHVNDNGFVVMLLRLNFFGSAKRQTFWEYYRPKYSFVHTKRMSFTDDGKTDSIEYMHCVWQKNYRSEFINTKLI